MSHEVFRDLLDKGAVLEFILMMSLSMALMRPLICVYLTRCCKDYMRTKQLCCKSFAKASKCQFLERRSETALYKVEAARKWPRPTTKQE
eukprot:scaffold159929_cov14-Tisochrysis_lutea.AAC.1